MIHPAIRLAPQAAQEIGDAGAAWVLELERTCFEHGLGKETEAVCNHASHSRRLVEQCFDYCAGQSRPFDARPTETALHECKERASADWNAPAICSYPEYVPAWLRDQARCDAECAEAVHRARERQLMRREH